jgi:hypothetical protein
VTLADVKSQHYWFVGVMEELHVPGSPQDWSGRMSETLKTRPAAGSASAFVVQSEVPSPQTDMWSQAGAAIELAYRTPVPATRAGRVAIALALVVATKLFWTGGLQ